MSSVSQPKVVRATPAVHLNHIIQLIILPVNFALKAEYNFNFYALLAPMNAFSIHLIHKKYNYSLQQIFLVNKSEKTKHTCDY